MFNKLNVISIATFAALAVSELKFRILAKQAARAYLEAHQAYEEQSEAQHAQMLYLWHKLEEHNVEIDEFDMIALNFDS